MTDEAKGADEVGRYEPGEIIVEGDLVVAQGRYSIGGKTLVATDFFRFEGDFVVEHWDVLREVAAGDEAADRSARLDVVFANRGVAKYAPLGKRPFSHGE